MYIINEAGSEMNKDRRRRGRKRAGGGDEKKKRNPASVLPHLKKRRICSRSVSNPVRVWGVRSIGVCVRACVRECVGVVVVCVLTEDRLGASTMKRRHVVRALPLLRRCFTGLWRFYGGCGMRLGRGLLAGGGGGGRSLVCGLLDVYGVERVERREACAWRRHRDGERHRPHARRRQVVRMRRRRRREREVRVRLARAEGEQLGRVAWARKRQHGRSISASVGLSVVSRPMTGSVTVFLNTGCAFWICRQRGLPSSSASAPADPPLCVVMRDGGSAMDVEPESRSV